MSFGLTFAVHFYDTIIAGLFCVAMALGFAFRFFRRKYFLPIIGSVLVSLAVAAAPMAVALVSGTPPQASLDWALGVIYGDSSTGTGQTGSSAAAEESADIEASAETEIRGGDGKQNWEEAAAVSESMLEYVFRENASQYYPLAVFAGIALCLILAVIYLPLKDADRSGMLVTVAVFQVFVLILLAADRLGLPSLMDSGRTSIYCAYTIPVLWSFALDGLAGLPDRICSRPRISSAIALVLTAATVVCLVETDQVKQPLAVEALESNDAVTCLTNIIRDREDKTWTICSTSDELHMAEDYGYHYEMIELLTGIENIGRYTGVTIPTEYVYFFVEKVPLDYYGTYEGSGQSVSAEGAMRELPTSTGSGAEYQTENRWIVMSRMYYWAEAFRQMYPENMTVYYETDTFICYQMNQNTERLFELGIDYGYNNYYG
jgi:hypothetical protein